MKQYASIAAVALVAVAGVGLLAQAVNDTVTMTVNDGGVGIMNSEVPAGEQELGITSRSDLTTTGDLTVGDDVTVGDDLTVTDDTAMTGNLTTAGHVKNTAGTITATTTLTVNSGNLQFLDTSAYQTTITLPTKTATGTVFRFVVRGALTGVTYQITSAEKDNISGTLIVAGAVVDCRDEDYINIITDGEAIGDYVEVISLGTTGWASLYGGQERSTNS
jgi:hypothetical protein